MIPTHALWKRERHAGFSLIEVVLALGIVSFALLGIVGLIPLGLSISREAQTTTVEAQIVQMVASDLLLTDYQNLAAHQRFFDAQGSALANDGPDVLYTVDVTLDALESPAALPPATVSGVVILVTNKTAPSARHRYPLVAVNNN